MAEHLYGEEWDSDEFQTALKVVLKCELQSLLERLSETGEETVLLTASPTDLCVGHLASQKALRFVNTADVGIVKNKFLNFLTGTNSQPQRPGQVVTGPVPRGDTGKVAQVSPVTNVTQKAPVQAAVTDSSAKKSNIKSATPNQTKVAEKRPLETVSMSQDFSVQSHDIKRRKTDIPLPPNKGNVNTSLQGPSNPSVSQAGTATVGKGPAPKLKTTKVVSKSGGFTEERISDAEFQKFLAQYKPNLAEGGQEENADQTSMLNTLRSSSMSQINPQKQFQTSQVSSVQNTQNKVTVNSITEKNIRTGVNQSGKTQSAQSTDLKKDNCSVKVENKCVNKENRESVNSANKDIVTEIKEEEDPTDSQYKVESQAAIKKENEQNVGKDKEKSLTAPMNIQKKEGASQSDRAGLSNPNRNRLESIDNLDTETLIQMTKAKHLQNMSEADREIQAKLGQLSSKLSWVVEYPKEKGQPGSSGQTTSAQRGQGSESSRMQASRMMLGEAFHDNTDDDLEEMDEDDFDDEDEFNEDDLDEEDKAALKAMREAHMRKLVNSGMDMGDFEEEGEIYAEGYNVSQNFHSGMGQEFPEDYDEEEGYEGFEDYSSEGELTGVNMAQVGNNTMPNLTLGQGDQPYQRTASPTSENFLMIGPIMAKCLICNKIVRKTEMKSHHETHLKEEEEYDDEEEEVDDDDDIEEMDTNIGQDEDGTFHEEQKSLQEGYDPEGEEYPQEEGEYVDDEGEYPQDEGEYSEDYEFQAEESEEGIEFTAETFVAEKLVAEKVGEFSDTSKDGKDNMCDICNKSFKSHNNMLRHRKNIHSVKEEPKDKKENTVNCPCPVCGKSFRYLQKHIKKMHPEMGEQSHSGDVSENSGDSHLSCSICGELFAEEDKLKEHFKVHG